MSTARLARTSRGVVLVLMSALAVGAWAVHVIALAALAPLYTGNHNVLWLMQLATLVTLIPCIACIVIGWMTVRGVRTPEDEGSPVGRTVFLGWMAIFVGLFNVLLIGLEALYVSVLPSYV